MTSFNLDNEKLNELVNNVIKNTTDATTRPCTIRKDDRTTIQGNVKAKDMFAWQELILTSAGSALMNDCKRLQVLAKEHLKIENSVKKKIEENKGG